MRIGQGFDVHRLRKAPGPLRLGGLQLEVGLALVGHSDGDVLLHAVCDAILGAAGLGDLGTHFPEDQASWQDADSRQLLKRVLEMAGKAGFRLHNVDSTIVAGRPRLAEHRQDIADSLARCCGLDAPLANVKLKSNEGFDATGRGEAIAAYAVALLLDDSD
jgi:2-C-methyl-D-erythritol 2,4-cyclodiphosphate synthase